MNRIGRILSASLLALVIVGCGSDRTRKEKVSAIINEVDAPFFIGTLTPQNLIDKSGAADGVLPFTYETLFGFFMLEEETGIANTEQIQIVLGKGSGFLPGMYGVFKVQNQEKFTTMLDKELNADIKEKDGYHYFVKKKDSYVMVWNDEFAMAANIPMDLASLFGGGDDSKKTVNKCIKLLDAANEGEINNEYVTFLNKQADIATYFNTEGLVDFLTSMKMVKKKDIAEYKESYEGNSFESFLNFENGEVKWKHEMMLSSFLLEKINFVEDKGINEELFNYGKTNNPMLKYSINVNPELLEACAKEQMKDEDFKEFEDGLEKEGFTLKEISATFTGEMLFMVDGAKTVIEMIDYGYGDPFESKNVEPLAGIAFGIKDKEVFAKLGKEMPADANGVFELKEGYYGCVLENVFFTSNDSAWINQVVTNNTKQVNDTEGNLKDEPFAFYSSFANTDHQDVLNSEFPISDVFENAWGYANLTEAELNLILKDKSQNSLRVITKMISDYLADEEMKANEEMKNILDQEVLESLENGVDNIEEGLNEIGEALEEIDVDKVVDDVFNGIGQ